MPKVYRLQHRVSAALDNLDVRKLYERNAVDCSDEEWQQYQPEVVVELPDEQPRSFTEIAKHCEEWTDFVRNHYPRVVRNEEMLMRGMCNLWAGIEGVAVDADDVKLPQNRQRELDLKDTSAVLRALEHWKYWAEKDRT